MSLVCDPTGEPFSIEYTAKVEIKPQRVSDLLTGAFEGGSNYWIGQIRYSKRLAPDEVQSWAKLIGLDDLSSNLSVLPFIPGEHLSIWADDESTEHKLDRAAIVKGLDLLASHKANWHWQNFINENDDAETADVFLQLCLFGEIVYG